MASDIVVVVPNHLPHLDFLNEWPELKNVKLIIVQDIGTKPEVPEDFDITIYDHKDIEDDLGDKAWIIPSFTSACRSYGYYKAWQLGAKYILTLDNDCYPDETDYYWVKDHIDCLTDKETLGWFDTIHGEWDGPWPRGVPYGIRNKATIVLNHGLWSMVPDFDAPTSLHYPELRLPPTMFSQVVPRYNFFPMCGMNLAWRSMLTPAMYFGLFGPEYGFDQYDDIWAGVIMKKIVDHLGYAVRSGYPSVQHRKQSNVFTNLRKQAPGMAMNEHFWKIVQKIELTSQTIVDSYKELITKLPDVIEDEPEGWTKKFKEAALIWVSLFQEQSQL